MQTFLPAHVTYTVFLAALGDIIKQEYCILSCISLSLSPFLSLCLSHTNKQTHTHTIDLWCSTLSSSGSIPLILGSGTGGSSTTISLKGEEEHISTMMISYIFCLDGWLVCGCVWEIEREKKRERVCLPLLLREDNKHTECNHTHNPKDEDQRNWKRGL